MVSSETAIFDGVALVTGATSGIGRAVALRLARGGMRVALSGRRGEVLDALVAELGAERALALPTDLRDERQVVAQFERIRARWGGVDVMVNNAGLGRAAPLTSAATDSDWWREMLEVNVLALTLCTREAVLDMRRRGDRGQVIHISSMAGHRVPPQSGMYAASKWAVRALTEALRQELRGLGSDIRVGSVSPGFVETGFHSHYHQSEEKAREIYARFPVLSADDVAEAVVFLLTQPAHVQVHDVLVRPTRQPA